jgi:acyl dehydratase
MGGDLAATVLLGERLELANDVPAVGQGTATSTVMGVDDRGPGKGAAIALQTSLTGLDGKPIARTTAIWLARHDGGCGAGPPIEPFDAVPASPCDEVRYVQIRLDQAVRYSRCGDTNPLHLSPETARKRGFDGPILHGLCTFAITSAAIHGDGASRLRSHGARFSAPVYPGERLRLAIWHVDAGIAFEAYACERKICVLCDGRSSLY